MWHRWLGSMLLLVATTAAADLDAGSRALLAGDTATALRELEPLAKRGDATAQFLLGFMYEEGRGVPADPALATQWYRKSAEQGYANAQPHNPPVISDKITITVRDPGKR